MSTGPASRARPRPTAPGTCETSNNWLGTARGRIGYAFDRFLPYFTAGAAFGDIKGTVGAVNDFSATKVGWTGGAGVEYAFIDNWSAKLEYLYVDLGKATCAAACSGGDPISVTLHHQHRARRRELQILSRRHRAGLAGPS